MTRLQPKIRDYAWGRVGGLTALVGVPDDGRPQAELWIGAHPGAPSTKPDGTALTIDDFGLVDDDAALLLKVLAIGQALSLQVHPTTQQAADGYAAEEAAGVSKGDPMRSFPDPVSKPEMLVALEPTSALAGFADGGRVAARLRAAADLSADPLLSELGDLFEADPASHLAALRLILDDPRTAAAIEALTVALSADVDSNPTPGSVEEWFALWTTLARQYPGDAGLLITALLEQVHLSPGEALYLPAGEIHAYLRGGGVEIMTNSDCVVRAGLTGKHVARDVFLDIVDVTVKPQALITPSTIADGVIEYRVPDPSAPFTLWRVQVSADTRLTLPSGPTLGLVIDGDIVDGPDAPLGRGSAWLVPGYAGGTIVAGAAGLDCVFVAPPGVAGPVVMSHPR